MELDPIKADKGNRLIVKYMGYNADEYAVVVNMHGYAYDQLKFHESYDWIMPVVHKISREIQNRSVIEMYVRKIATLPVSSTVYTVWLAVLDYIHWYYSDEGKHALAIDDECRMHYTDDKP